MSREKSIEKIASKHNALIQSMELINKVNLSQLRFFLFVLSKIDSKFKDKLHLLKINVDEASSYIYRNTGGYQNETLTVAEELHQFLKVEIAIHRTRNGHPTMVLTHLFTHMEIIPYQGIIELGLHESLSPYLIELKNNFTQIQLEEASLLKSKHSLLLYEYLLSFSGKKSFVSAIVKLKTYLQVENYDMKNFTRLIKNKINEINEKTSITYDYKFLKDGRKYHSIEFLLRKKTNKTDKKINETEDNAEVEFEYKNRLYFTDETHLFQYTENRFTKTPTAIYHNKSSSSIKYSEPREKILEFIKEKEPELFNVYIEKQKEVKERRNSERRSENFLSGSSDQRKSDRRKN